MFSYVCADIYAQSFRRHFLSCVVFLTMMPSCVCADMHSHSGDISCLVLCFWPLCLHVCVQICTVIQEIFPDGAVSRDGRLKPGDQILEVREFSHYLGLSVVCHISTTTKVPHFTVKCSNNNMNSISKLNTTNQNWHSDFFMWNQNSSFSLLHLFTGWVFRDLL